MKPLQILAEKYNLVHQESAGGPVINANGNKIWYNDNREPHRLDGPAIEWDDGSKEWWVNGKPHRLDGPAVECANGGHKEWFVNGKRHRLDGPAIEYANGAKAWYIDDIHYTEKGFNRYLKAVKARQDILNKDNPGIEMDI